MEKKEPGPFERLSASLIMLFLLWLLFRWIGGGAKPVDDAPTQNPSPAAEAPASVQNTTPIRKNEECLALSGQNCYFSMHKEGKISWHDAESDCSTQGGALPSKADIQRDRALLSKLVGNSASPEGDSGDLAYLWASESEGTYNGSAIYGWGESISGYYQNSNWMKADSDKRDYVGYICVKSSGNGNAYRTAPARPNNDNKIAEANVQGIRAYTCAIGKMKSLLKSPSSADFPWTADGAAQLDNGKIMVNGHVDAENSYGAKMRTNFTCVVENPDDSGCLDDLSRVDCSTSG